MTKIIDHEEAHKKLMKEFYMNSSSENLKRVFDNVQESENTELIEDFIKLCCISADKEKFELFLQKIVEEHKFLAVKYYDEFHGYGKCQEIAEKYFEEIKQMINGEKQIVKW